MYIRSTAVVVVFLIISILIYWDFVGKRSAGTASPQSMLAPVPDELVFGNEGTVEVVKSSTRNVRVSTFAGPKKVNIRRVERPNAQSAWVKQEQEVSTSYNIVDARGYCDRELYLVGAYDAANATIERWTFLHPPSTDAGGQYIPLDQRRLPGIRKQVLYLGSQYGLIRALDVDPNGRYLYFLTLTSHTLYKMNLSDSAVEEVCSPATVPQMQQMKNLFLMKHVTEGWKLFVTPRRGFGDAQQVDPNWYEVVLEDPEDDGNFSVPFVMDETSESQHGYTLPASWLYIDTPYSCN